VDHSVSSSSCQEIEHGRQQVFGLAYAFHNELRSVRDEHQASTRHFKRMSSQPAQECLTCVAALSPAEGGHS
jgi:hypothetical protein